MRPGRSHHLSLILLALTSSFAGCPGDDSGGRARTREPIAPATPENAGAGDPQVAALLQRAREALYHDDYAEALDVARQIAAKRGGPTSPSVPDTPTGELEAIIELCPDLEEAYARRAFDRANAGDAAGACADWSAYIELRPDEVIGYFNRGSNRLQTDDLVGAAADYARSVELEEPPSAITYSCLATVLLLQGSLPEAQVALDAAIAAPTLPDERVSSHELRAIARLLAGDADAALVECEAALAGQGPTTFAHLLRGLVQHARGEAAAALDDLRQASAAPVAAVQAACWAEVLLGKRLEVNPARAELHGAWSGLLKLVHGEQTLDEVLAEPQAAGTAWRARQRAWQAYGVAGALAERAGDVEAARRHYAACLAVGSPPDLTRTHAWVWARFRLAALDAR